MRLAKRWLGLGLEEVQLVTSEHVHGSDALQLVLEEVALLNSVVEAFLAQSFTQYLCEVGSEAFSVVHKLQSWSRE